MIENLYSMLSEFKSPTYNIEQKIYREICKFNNKHFTNNQPYKDSKFYYEEIAFAFIEGKNPPEEYGDSFYKPHFGCRDSITKKWKSFYPDIQNITREMVNYWEQRSSKVNNPILQCRYSGLVWDFSQKIRNIKPEISVAHRFIDSIIKISNLGGDPFLKHKLERALRLAVSLDDKNRIASVRDAIIQYEDTYSEDDKPGTWGYSYDFLIGDKDLYSRAGLNKEQEEKIIKELERKLQKFSDKNSKICKPHSVEHIITKLAPYYKDKDDAENMKRVLLTYKDSFLYGIKQNLVILGSYWLDKIRKILFQYGLSSEASKLENNIHSLQKEDLKYLQKVETSIKLPKQEFDNYISELNKKNLSEALNCIALSFVPDKETAESIVLKSAKEHPLQFMISGSIMDHTGRKVAIIDPIENDLEGHIVNQMFQSMNFNLYWVGLGLKHLEESKSLNANLLAEHLFKSPVFPKKNYKIIEEGLIAYFNKNYIASCSILAPQIESAIRELVFIAGGAIYKTPRNSNETGFELRPLGSLLRDNSFIKTFEKLNNNIPDFFKIILLDKRALNLRNMICHGHFIHFNQGNTIYIIHILLILSLLRRTKKS